MTTASPTVSDSSGSNHSSLADDSVPSFSPASLLTSAVFNITYDGAHFHGWSAGNDDLSPQKSGRESDVSTLEDAEEEDEFEYGSRPNGGDFLPPLKSNRRMTVGRKRRRGTRIPGIGQVRSVQGQLRQHIAKLYGDVDPNMVQVEGCSRTDKGVHAKSMIALVYCLSKDASPCSDSDQESETGIRSNIPGKRTPHPSSPTDNAAFMTLPFNGDLDKMRFVLNRMLPPDLRVSDVSPMPSKAKGDLPFHPTLDAREKTYRYTFSVGHIHDPIRWRHVWHVETSRSFRLDIARDLGNCFVGRHDFAAFRGAFRGSERGKTQESVCTLSSLSIEREVTDEIDCVGSSPIDGLSVGESQEEAAREGVEPLATFTVTVTGNRFLYKMVRFLVGSMVAVGLERVPSDDVKEALSRGSWDVSPTSGMGKKGVICAPSHGLCLLNVDFGPEIASMFKWRE